MLSSLPPPPAPASVVPGASGGATWWQILLMGGSLAVMVLVAGDAFGLSLTTVCRPEASAAACQHLERTISVGIFAQALLVVVGTGILLLGRLTWGRRTGLVVLGAGLSIALDVLVRHLVSVSPAR